MLLVPELEEERDEEERAGDERETLALVGLLNDRVDGELLEGAKLFDEDDLELGEEDLILEYERLGVE